MRGLAIVSMLLVAALGACRPAPAEQKAEEVAPASAAITLGDFTTAAKITAVTDAGYPMYVVAAQIPGQPTLVEMMLNAEHADLDGIDRQEFVGQDVVLTYAVVAENDLYDLRDGDLSLVQETQARAPHWKEVTGVLSGAESSTGGDLPDLIAVTDTSGVKVEFSYFVTPQIAAANGKPVTAWYAPGAGQYVKSLRLVTTAEK